MSELLPEKQLRESTEGRNIARVRTITVLPRLNAQRKSSVLHFLFEAGLIYRNNIVVDLREANLSGADLSEAKLSRANLSGASVRMADLSRAELN